MPSAKGPLRKILGHHQDKEGYFDHLECGHCVPCDSWRHDLTGRTTSAMHSVRSRHCKKCGERTQA